MQRWLSRPAHRASVSNFQMNIQTKESDSFDFIIVGAGSAGSLLAARLAESSEHSVLVLEAGGSDRRLWVHVPIGFAKTILDKSINWAYQTEPQAELNNRSIYWPRGKLLGGSGAINGLVHIRGQHEDFESWKRSGCEGWGWDDVLPYFKRMEDHYLGASPLHGAGGPIAVHKPQDRSPLGQALIEAAARSGIPPNDDFNGETQAGAGDYDLTIRNGRRSNSAMGALKPALRTGRVRLELNAMVQRVIFEGSRATGVQFRVGNGPVMSVRAKREVVLCGGAINTPQLLMLSGIGSADSLKAHGIKVVADRPEVGRNLQDHLVARFVFKTKRPITLNDQMKSFWGRLGIGMNYVFRRRGALTYAAAQAGMFFKSEGSVPRVDVQAFFSPYSADGAGKSLHSFSAFTLTLTQSWPTSRGYIALRDADPSTAPIIQPNYFSTAHDREFFVKAIRRTRQILDAEPIRSEISEEFKPGPMVRTDDQIIDYVRSTASTCFHPCGTCRMGADEDSVVDLQLRVRGVDGLRIADASVMPSLTSGNINAPVLMIAEKAAEMMRRATRD